MSEKSKLNFYSHEKISDRLYIFTEGYSAEFRFTIGVIVGDEKIMVVDAGLGMAGGFREYIESVVGKEKPMVCYCTHGNVDHIGSAIEFEEAYLNSRDYYMLPWFGLHTPTRFGDLTAFSCDSPEVLWYAVNHYTPNTETKFLDVDEGTVIDLGGIQIEPIRVPAHSPGSLAYFCRSEKFCFTGDAIHIQTHIKRLDNEEMREYARIIQRFIDIVGEDCTLYAGHCALGQPIRTAQNLVQACLEVADGKVDLDPPAEMIFKNQKNGGDRNLRYHYYGNTCVIYNRSIIKNEEELKKEEAEQ